jgi:acyl carrier protein
MNSAVQLDKEAILGPVREILEDITQDWDLDCSGEISSQTRLIADLAFESIDVVMLIVAIEERFGRKGLPFENLLMVDGRYVDDLSVQQMVDFLLHELA